MNVLLEATITDILSGTAITDVNLQQEVAHVTSWLEEVTPLIVPSLIKIAINIIVALLVFAIGKRLISLLKKIVKKAFIKQGTEASVSRFLYSLISISANCFLVLIVVGILGINTTSVLALVGSAGLTIGLAFQGSLSNFAGGVLILLMKPFRIGDYIITKDGEEGTVTDIDIFYTKLLTVDNRKVVIPNGNLSNTSIVNVTNEEKRRIDLLIPIEYDEDIRKVKKLLLDLVMSKEMVLKAEPILVFVNSFDSSSISIGVRVWAKTEEYWILKWELLEEIKYLFDQHGIVIPFDQLDVNIVNKKEEK